MDTASQGYTTEPNSIFCVQGVVKWFNAEKGYGFVVPDTGDADVLLHLATVLRDKTEVPLVGAQVTILCQSRQKGVCCVQVLAVNNATAVESGNRPPVIVSSSQDLESPWHRVSVKWFNAKKGYGFGVATDNIDVFIHKKIVCGCGLTELNPEQVIEVRWFDTGKGRQAAAVRVLS